MKKRPLAEKLYDPLFEQDSCGTGFIVNIKKKTSHSIVHDALTMLKRMQHRGARGADKNTGDGTGILTSLPHEYFKKICEKENLSLPQPGLYAVGNIFLPNNKEEQKKCKTLLEQIMIKQSLQVVFWRKVPVNSAIIGKIALACKPEIEQCFIISNFFINTKEFERSLFIASKETTTTVRNSQYDTESMFYICSLSSQSITYKGMLTHDQLDIFYKDLKEEEYSAYMALVHSRFSTNTFPSWDRAQPLRIMSHNGEINTLYGNENKMHAREGKIKNGEFKEILKNIFPIIQDDVSDSGAFDNTLEFLYHSGYSLPQAICMMIPEAWQHDKTMSKKQKAMYKAYSCIMEPWDGPACITFTNGRYVGAVIDRSGLRPSRYYITNDDRVILASEVGVVDIEPENIISKNRIKLGKIFLIDTDNAKIISDEQIKKELSEHHPYMDWIQEEEIQLSHIEQSSLKATDITYLSNKERKRRSIVYIYSEEDKIHILKSMIEKEKEPLGSMGNDVALACLSTTPRLLYDYFKQLFAQVTNPPIDSIRERIIMSIGTYIGPEGNILKFNQSCCHRLWLEHPILSHEDFALLKKIQHRKWKSCVIDITYNKREREIGLKNALSQIKKEAEEYAKKGYQIIILSDKAINKERIPISTLMASAAVHHHLVDKCLRSMSALVVESGEMREVHHYSMLLGYGVDALFPYLAFENAFEMRDNGILENSLTNKEIVKRYKNAVEYGICKVFSKMGISTIDSYKGSQIFEAIGIGEEVIAHCFKNTISRISGVGFAELEKEMFINHENAYKKWEDDSLGETIISAGNFHWRKKGHLHMWDPESIILLQSAVRKNNKNIFNDFVNYQNQRSPHQSTLRGMLTFKKQKNISLHEVEPTNAIIKRFATGAMSFGSISQEAHETLAIAMNRIGGKSNTGEGGEDPSRYISLANGDSKRSAIKQVASGRFGVTIEYLSNADEIQIKMAQGAKPGEGGELPGHKVFDIIAKTRHSTPGIGLISPPPHHDIYSIEDLAQLIFDLKNANPSAKISVKLVSKSGVGVIAAGVAKGKADNILISGHDGGTGASPLTSIKHTGLPWELGISETHQVLIKNNLRSRVILQTDGQLKTGRDIAIAAMLGAEEFGFATSALISMGCIMMRKCEYNTCPVGIATQNNVLRKKFMGTPEHVIAFMTFLAEDLRKEMAQLGFKTVNEMVGRSDILTVDTNALNWKSKKINIFSLLSDKKHEGLQCCTTEQEHNITSVLDKTLIRDASKAIETGSPIKHKYTIKNTNRTTGTLLSHTIAKKYGMKGLPQDTIHITFDGHAGQSFGAFLAHGVTLSLNGDANDYVGKGLSGGIIALTPPKQRKFIAEDNIIAGNVALYGATCGKAFFNGRVAERFCIRNSGAKVVVEGIGTHGCEYMTNGRVIILGDIGKNFASGMSGGIAYIYDTSSIVRKNINSEMIVSAIPLAEKNEVKALIKEHYKRTASKKAKYILDSWNVEKNAFIRIISKDYQNILSVQKQTLHIQNNIVL